MTEEHKPQDQKPSLETRVGSALRATNLLDQEILEQIAGNPETAERIARLIGNVLSPKPLRDLLLHCDEGGRSQTFFW